MPMENSISFAQPNHTNSILHFIGGEKVPSAQAELLRSTNLLKMLLVRRWHVGDWGDTQRWAACHQRKVNAAINLFAPTKCIGRLWSAKANGYEARAYTQCTTSHSIFINYVCIFKIEIFCRRNIKYSDREKDKWRLLANKIDMHFIEFSPCPLVRYVRLLVHTTHMLSGRNCSIAFTAVRSK